MHNFDLVIITGFGDKGVKELKDSLTKKLEPKSSHVISGCPPHKAFFHPDTLIEQIDKTIESIGTEKILLIGHSYGALLALAYAMRTKMRNILQLILIDGPLNPNTSVTPSKLTHRIFARQYEHRTQIAEDCIRQLEKLDASNVATIGNKTDTIVPFESKSIPGGHRIVVRKINGKPAFLKTTPDKKPYNFTLPEAIRGHGLHQKIPLLTDLISKIVPADA